MRTVAVAILNQEFHADRLFELEPDGPVDQAPYTPWRRVRELGAERGFRFVTADRVQTDGLDPREVLLVSYDWVAASDALVAAGAHPMVLLSLEPPIIAWRLYFGLRRISRPFAHVFLFEGARPRVAPGVRFHPLHFPQVRQAGDVAGPPWAERRFLVMMGGNKGIVRSPLRFFDRPREYSVKRELATLLYPPIADELYTQRLRLIAHFADAPDFGLFGHGWQRRHPSVSPRDHAPVARAFRGSAANKLQTLASYRFAFALENSRFPGYVSEKLFDCFFAGCVPLYDGAPDVARYVPPETFVDLRQFRDHADLERYLRAMTPAEAARYLEAARAFLASPAYTPFTHERFAEALLAALAGVGG